MSDLHVRAATPPAPIRPIQRVEPPKARPEPKPAPPPAVHGPAVVLSGAVAKPPEHRAQQAAAKPTGHHADRLI